MVPAATCSYVSGFQGIKGETERFEIGEAVEPVFPKHVVISLVRPQIDSLAAWQPRAGAEARVRSIIPTRLRATLSHRRPEQSLLDPYEQPAIPGGEYRPWIFRHDIV